MRDAREIANFILDHAESEGVPLTNMGLLKILYYAQAWHLKDFGTPLVANKFEAWAYGPVIRIIYDAFKKHGAEPIKSRATRFDATSGKYITAKGNLEDELKNFLINKVFKFYGTKDPLVLSNMTHEIDAPWDIIFSKFQKEVHLRAEIPNELIKDYFSKTNN